MVTTNDARPTKMQPLKSGLNPYTNEWSSTLRTYTAGPPSSVCARFQSNRPSASLAPYQLPVSYVVVVPRNTTSQEREYGCVFLYEITHTYLVSIEETEAGRLYQDVEPE